MAQVAQMREPQARQRVALDRPGGRDAGEIAVREREDREPWTMWREDASLTR